MYYSTVCLPNVMYIQAWCCKHDSVIYTYIVIHTYIRTYVKNTWRYVDWDSPDCLMLEPLPRTAACPVVITWLSPAPWTMWPAVMSPTLSDMGVAASAAASCFFTSSFLCLCFFLCSCLIGSFGKILLNWSGNYNVSTSIFDTVYSQLSDPLYTLPF